MCETFTHTLSLIPRPTLLDSLERIRVCLLGSSRDSTIPFCVRILPKTWYQKHGTNKNTCRYYGTFYRRYRYFFTVTYMPKTDKTPDQPTNPFPHEMNRCDFDTIQIFDFKKKICPNFDAKKNYMIKISNQLTAEHLKAERTQSVEFTGLCERYKHQRDILVRQANAQRDNGKLGA